MTYVIKITEKIIKFVSVEADSRDEAKNMAIEMNKQEKIPVDNFNHQVEIVRTES